MKYKKQCIKYYLEENEKKIRHNNILSRYDGTNENLPRFCILVSGYAGSGKDTVGEYIRDNYSFVKASFATPVKEIGHIAFNLDLAENKREGKEIKLLDYQYSPREIYQKIGQGLRDLFHPTIWSENLIKRSESTKNLVICDNRYSDEIEVMKKYYEVITIRIHRDLCDGNVGIENHESENLDFISDYMIVNNDSIEELYQEVDKLMIKIFYDLAEETNMLKQILSL